MSDQQPVLSMIAAMDLNRGIGYQGGLPWPKMPADLRRFRNLTLGRPVIMGRVTASGLNKGCPLPGRKNIVLSKQAVGLLTVNGFFHARTRDEALAEAYAADVDEIFIIGGATVYDQFAEEADRLYLTLIEGRFPADTYFPRRVFDRFVWRQDSFSYPADSLNPYPFDFVRMDKIREEST